MFRDITIGQYYGVDSPIHRLDPRTKLGATILYVTLLFLVQDAIWYVPIAATVLMVYRMANIPLSYVFRGLRAIILLLCFTFFFRMTLTPGEELFRFWIFPITREGIQLAIRMTARIGLMIVGASLLSYTTTPRELADGMETGLSFMEKWGVPIHSMAVIVMIAFRFIPVLTEEMNILMDAQAARGAEFENCSVWKKTKNVCSLLMPLFFSTVRRSTDLAMAMEARGYQEGAETTRMYPLEYTATDKKATTFMWVFCVGIGVLMLITGILF